MTALEEALLAEATSAVRGRDSDGTVREHRAFRDLPAEHREALYEETARLRRLEAALDPAGLSQTARELLRRIVR